MKLKPGDKVGKLTLISKNKADKHQAYFWVCKCDCGVIKTFRSDRITDKTFSKSCGCVNKCRTIEEYIDEYIMPEPNTGCWLWTGPLFKGGYGRLTVASKESNGSRSLRAHRAIYKFITGRQITKDVFLCHHCDTPSCVNPDHLFEGTQIDNMKDMVKKKRQAVGDKLHAKLKSSDVLELRKAKADNPSLTYRYLGNLYGITNAQAWQIVKRNYFKYL